MSTKFLTGTLADHIATTRYTHKLDITLSRVLDGKTPYRASTRDLPDFRKLLTTYFNEIKRYQLRGARRAQIDEAELHFLGFLETNTRGGSEVIQPHYHCMLTIVDALPPDSIEYLQTRLVDVARRRWRLIVDIQIESIEDSHKCAEYACKHVLTHSSDHEFFYRHTPLTGRH